MWLLYNGPVLLRGNICKNLFERFHLLSYATRLLLFSNEHTVLADQLIKRFYLLTVEAYTEKVFSANIHALNHLAWQVGCFGPLWCTSAMMFKSANYLLKCKLTGTVNHLKLLIERYVRNKLSCQEVSRADRLQDLCFSLRKLKTFKRRCVPLHEAPPDLKQLSIQIRNLNISISILSCTVRPKTPLCLLILAAAEELVKFECFSRVIKKISFHFGHSKLCLKSDLLNPVLKYAVSTKPLKRRTFRQLAKSLFSRNFNL